MFSGNGNLRGGREEIREGRAQASPTHTELTCGLQSRLSVSSLSQSEATAFSAAVALILLPYMELWSSFCIPHSVAFLFSTLVFFPRHKIVIPPQQIAVSYPTTLHPRSLSHKNQRLLSSSGSSSQGTFSSYLNCVFTEGSAG